mmetsp:Transcript_29937/g.77385  ORF Transcript_29937/g.77385 Transcript_29937/m.77385 type:complete len:464 (-) Transcript_29937:44-1435(-)
MFSAVYLCIWCQKQRLRGYIKALNPNICYERFANTCLSVCSCERRASTERCRSAMLPHDKSRHKLQQPPTRLSSCGLPLGPLHIRFARHSDDPAGELPHIGGHLLVVRGWSRAHSVRPGAQQVPRHPAQRPIQEAGEQGRAAEQRKLRLAKGSVTGAPVPRHQRRGKHTPRKEEVIIRRPRLPWRRGSVHDRRGSVAGRGVQRADDGPERRPREEAAPVPDAAVDAAGVHRAGLHPQRQQAAVQLAAEQGVGQLGVLVLPLAPVVEELLGVIQHSDSVRDTAHIHHAGWLGRHQLLLEEPRQRKRPEVVHLNQAGDFLSGGPWLAEVGAGVVHQDVERHVLLLKLLHKAAHAVQALQVQLRADLDVGAWVPALDQRGGVLRLLAVPGAQNDGGAQSRQRRGGLEADATGGARHERHLARELQLRGGRHRAQRPPSLLFASSPSPLRSKVKRTSPRRRLCKERM